jgi:cysteine desulfurase
MCIDKCVKNGYNSGMNKTNKIYLDNAATTYVAGEVMAAMMPYFTTEYGNCASMHSFGRAAEKAVAKARVQIAKAINAEPNEIYFTSGATEANNWILNGIMERSKVRRALISSIEHPSVIEVGKSLAARGYKVEYIKVDKDGIISVADMVAKLGKPAAVVSIMTANSEVGTIQFLNTVAHLAKERGALFHTDATQAIGALKIDVKAMNIDALSLSAHKIYGPKGIGALYIRNGVNVGKFMLGGGQERSQRSGTVNIPGAVGFGEAVALTMRDSSTNNARIKQLRDYLISEIESKIEHAKLNGHRTQRLPNNANFSFPGVEGESILMMLDFAGVAVSTGSACSSGSLERSHVLKAMGVKDEHNQGSIRFSLGRNTTREDIDFTVAELVKIVKKLRSMSAIRG